MSYSVAMLSIHTSPLDNPGRTKDAGGMNVYMRQLAYELGQHQHYVDFFTRWTDSNTPRIVQVSENVRVIHIQAGPLAPVHKHDLDQYIPAFVQQIEVFARQEAQDYDVLHSHYWLSGVAAQQLAHRWDIPHVTMFHTLGRLKQLANPNEEEPELRLEMEQRLLQSADCIIATTAEERAHIIRLSGASARHVEVIPCGVDLTLFAPQSRRLARKQLGLDEQCPVLLFVGRLDPFKGPDVLLHAASMMEEEAQIVIVGGKLSGDADIQHLQTLASNLGISHRVHFLGARPQQELPMIYSAADATVMPSYHESFGLVAVESLACGTPVVATRVGGLMTIVRHDETGFLVPRCPGFFAAKLDLFLQHPDIRERMRAAARRSILHFSWKNVASQIHRVYNGLLEEARPVAAR
jgi:D-inositol-3-phosphate glycosyltransferase